jgi:hypothetical protein
MSDAQEPYFDPNLDFEWTGKHSFSNEIKFSSNQKFNSSQFFISNDKPNSILVSLQNKISLLEATDPSSYLQFDGINLAWKPLILSSSALGVLEVKNGGTGWHKVPSQGILYFEANSFKTLALQNNKTLTSKENKLEWIDLNTSVTEIIDQNPNILGLQSSISNIKITETGLTFKITSDKDPEEKEDFHLTYDLLKKSVFEKTDKTVLTEDIKGILSFNKGGLGFNNIERGDIVFGFSDNNISKLSAVNHEGKVLKVVNGLPQWQDIDIKEELKTQLKDITFIKEENQSLIFDGVYRYELATIDSNINGKASGLTQILPAEKGGTGLNLSELPLGSIIVKNTESNKFFAIQPGEDGKSLQSNGPNQIPSYEYQVENINTDKYLNSEKQRNQINLKLNTDVDFDWLAEHRFKTITVAEEIKTNVIKLENRPDNQPVINSLFKRNNDLIYNKDGIDYCLSQNFIQETKENHILKICDNASLVENTATPFNVMFPYTSGKAHEEQLWKLKRIDIYCHTIAEQDAEIDFVCDKQSILNQEIIINAFVNKSCSFNFSRNQFHSGDMIFVKTKELYGADNFTIWAVIEKIN